MIVTRTKDGHLLWVTETVEEEDARCAAVPKRAYGDLTQSSAYTVEPDEDSGGFRLVPL